jgi:hypothetical protein
MPQSERSVPSFTISLNAWNLEGLTPTDDLKTHPRYADRRKLGVVPPLSDLASYTNSLSVFQRTHPASFLLSLLLLKGLFEDLRNPSMKTSLRSEPIDCGIPPLQA